MAAFLTLLLSVLLLGASAKPQARQKRQATQELDACSHQTFDLGLYNDATFSSSEECRTNVNGGYPHMADWNMAYVKPVGARYVNIDYLVDIENDNNCNYDSLTFGAGRAGESVKLCGLQDGEFSLPLDEDESRFNVTFNSDASVNADGFQYSIYFTDDYADFPTDNLPELNGRTASNSNNDNIESPSSSSNNDYGSASWALYSSSSYAPYNYNPASYDPYNSYSSSSYDPYSSYSSSSYDPYNYNSYSSSFYDPYNYNSYSSSSYDPYNSYSSSSYDPYNYNSYSSSSYDPYNYNSYGSSSYDPNNYNSYGSSSYDPYNYNSYSSSSYDPYNYNSYDSSSYDPYNYNSYSSSSYDPYNYNSYGSSSYEPYNYNSYGSSSYEPYNYNSLSSSSYEPYTYSSSESFADEPYSTDAYTFSYDPYSSATNSYEPYTYFDDSSDGQTANTDSYYASASNYDSYNPRPDPALDENNGDYDVDRTLSRLAELRAELADLKRQVEESQQSLRDFEAYLDQLAGEGVGDSNNNYDNYYGYGAAVPAKK